MMKERFVILDMNKDQNNFPPLFVPLRDQNLIF